jgi:hypothetical protein
MFYCYYGLIIPLKQVFDVVDVDRNTLKNNIIIAYSTLPSHDPIYS